MPEQTVCSPVTRKGSKVGSSQPMSPGARSSPSRLEGSRFDSVPAQPPHVSRNAEQPSELKIHGPED